MTEVKLFLHTRVAGEGTNATIRGGEWLATTCTTSNAMQVAKDILDSDRSVGRITLHANGQVIDTVTR